jgi:hypothetical protein
MPKPTGNPHSQSVSEATEGRVERRARQGPGNRGPSPPVGDAQADAYRRRNPARASYWCACRCDEGQRAEGHLGLVTFRGVQAEGIPHRSDPFSHTNGQVNTRRGGRGFFSEDPSGYVLEVLTVPGGRKRADLPRLSRACDRREGNWPFGYRRARPTAGMRSSGTRSRPGRSARGGRF